MHELRHRTLSVHGLRMHVAEQGVGPLILLCHGFPELWYSYRHQLPALAAAGFRAVAPDMRGYGDTDAPADPAAYSIFHLVGDMVGLVEALGERRAIIVGHDWGAPVAWNSALMRPDVFYAVVGMSVPFRGRGPADPMEIVRTDGPDDYYWTYFQPPGVAEAELERDVNVSMRRFLYACSGDAPAGNALGFVRRGDGILDRMPEPEVLPSWLTEDDLAVYASTFRRTGFRGGLNWYRNLSRNWAQLAPWQGAKIRQPAAFLAGTREPVLAGKHGARALDGLREAVPQAQVTMLEGAGHWTQQERAAEVNAALIAFAHAVSG